MPRIDLQDVAAELAGTGPGTTVYLSTETGECCPVTDGFDEMWEDFDFEQDHWIVLPDSMDRDEWDMMRSFAESRATGRDTEKLLRSIRGRGAFRAFKNTAHELGLLQSWYHYLHDETVEIVRRFLQHEGIEFEEGKKQTPEPEEAFSPAARSPAPDESLRTSLKSQLHAALAMLRQGIADCPDDLWDADAYGNRHWQVAYHALFFAHLYLCEDEASFSTWDLHQADCQYPDGIPGPADPDSPLPLVPDPYTKEQLLDYWAFCDAFVDPRIDEVDLGRAESGFHWYPIPKLEHLLVNLRHIQHHAAQLADRMRSTADIGVDWVGARRPAT